MERSRRAVTSISMVIPVYNEAGNIQSCAQSAIATLKSIADTFEVIFVESGSTDGTGELADELAKANESISVIHQGAKKGLGNALREGFSAARYEIVFYIDGDSPFDMANFKKTLPILAEADIVNGYRLNRNDTPIRAIYSRVYNWMVRLLFHLRVKDVNIGFKAIKKSVLQEVELRSDSNFIDAELLVQAQRLGYKIVELGVEYVERTSGTSTVSFKTVLHMLRDMLNFMRFYYLSA